MLEEENWFIYFATKTSTHLASYILLAGFSYLIFWVWKKKEWLHIKIQAHFPESTQLQHELIWSFVNIAITGCMNVGLYFMYKADITMIYVNISSHGWTYMFASFLLLLLLHDTYFYWTHRMMHVGKIYDWVHKVHHYSVNPTPWTTHSQHPMEVVLQNLFLPMMVLWMPLHPFAIGAFMLTATLFNLIGHLGFELFPRFFIHSILGKIFLSSTYHNMHHERKTQNFGLYFFFWDRLMNTYHRDYSDRFDTLTSGSKK